MATRSNTRAAQQVTSDGVATTDCVAVTAASIADAVAHAMTHLDHAFREMEQRIVADNGKAYPLDASLPDGVQDTGSVTFVDRNGFLTRSLVSVVTWKLESMLDTIDKRIEDQKVRIRSAVRDIERGRAEPAIVDRMADFLEVQIEQRAMVLAAFNASLEAHQDLLGEAFETKGQRIERQRLIEASSQGNPRSARLKALGL